MPSFLTWWRESRCIGPILERRFLSNKPGSPPDKRLAGAAEKKPRTPFALHNSRPLPDMIDQKDFDRLTPLAYQWAKSQEAYVLQYGVPLALDQIADAARAGVKDPSRVRVLVVDRIPLPENKELAEAARHAQIITDSSRAVAIGRGIIIRADSWQNRELLLHQLVHVAQCERSGSLESFINEYLLDRRGSRDFSLGYLEDEARSFAREICAGPKTAKQKV
jgi:hypothetical protein